MEDLAFSFEEDRHIYRNAAGIERPSVTGSLTAQGIFNFSMVVAPRTGAWIETSTTPGWQTTRSHISRRG